MRLDPHPSLVIHSGADRAAIRTAVKRGDLVRLVAGRYVSRIHWDAFSAEERDIMRIVAAASSVRGVAVVSHTSAALLWGIPRLGPMPTRVHFTDTRLEQTVINASTVRHCAALSPADIMESHGVLVTAPARTAVDVALCVPFRHAVVALDHCLRVGLTTKDALLEELGRRPRARNRAAAARAIEFADHRANRPGESLSRVVMHEARVSAPELQHRFVGPDGQTADADFYWPASGRVGEFDGLTKYRDSERWSGLPAHEVVVKEKAREDWMRARRDVKSFSRWTWREALTPGYLARLLAQEVEGRSTR